MGHSELNHRDSRSAFNVSNLFSLAKVLIKMKQVSFKATRKTRRTCTQDFRFTFNLLPFYAETCKKMKKLFACHFLSRLLRGTPRYSGLVERHSLLSN